MSEKLDFMLREISVESNDPNFAGMSVTRTRNSTGFSQITIKAGNQRIIFSSDNYKDKYEIAARELMELMDTIVDDYCKLPELK